MWNPYAGVDVRYLQVRFIVDALLGLCFTISVAHSAWTRWRSRRDVHRSTRVAAEAMQSYWDRSVDPDLMLQTLDDLKHPKAARARGIAAASLDTEDAEVAAAIRRVVPNPMEKS